MRLFSRMFPAFFVFAALCVAGTPVAAQPLAPSSTDERGLPTLAPVLKKVMPGVVNIAVQGRIPVEQNPLYQDPFFRRYFGIPDQPPEREFQSTGSGVVVDAENGFVLTNNHVIARADKIVVGLQDGRRLPARLLGGDPETDIAVLQIPAKDLVAVPKGNSEELQVGDYVIAIGNPFGLGQTVTSGIVSALERSGLDMESYEEYIQTDAAINPGNSGGALVDLRGRLVGINTAIVGPTGGNVGIGFAIPVNMANEVMEQIHQYGSVQRGQLGVVIQDLDPEKAKALVGEGRTGAVVVDVAKGSAAERAGLKKGDVVLSVNGIALRTATQLRNRIGVMRIGQKVDLRILRNGKEIPMKAQIAPRQG